MVVIVIIITVNDDNGSDDKIKMLAVSDGDEFKIPDHFRRFPKIFKTFLRFPFKHFTKIFRRFSKVF